MYHHLSFPSSLMVLKSILSIPQCWQNGGYRDLVVVHTYDHLTRRIAIDPDSIRFCDFHNSMIDFSSDDLIFFSTHKFHLYVEMSNLLNLKKCFQHKYSVTKFSNINVSIDPTNLFTLFFQFLPTVWSKTKLHNSKYYDLSSISTLDFFVLFLSKKRIPLH